MQMQVYMHVCVYIYMLKYVIKLHTATRQSAACE